jgi:alkanesulfonate monooxygenase SsuD/methylene tetrahydromethanopterin reductase-like flavin-dependent oxidoreductase (luciferase family)
MTRFGVLLLHFGHTASRASVIDTAPQLEAWGFDSVWVRDHLTFQPHGFERPSTVFMEPFSTLTAIATITTRLVVGTATIIPFRHPLVTSQLFGGVSMVAGPGRVIAGIGAGAPTLPFAATGLPYEDRFDAVKEMAEILRLTWTQPRASYEGRLYRFEGVTIDPHPPADTPIWYGGSTPASVRRALEYCDGWFPGRCPLRTFDRYLARVRAGAEEQGRTLGVGIIPCISVARSREEAVAAVDVEGLLAEARSRRFWDGPFETVDDLEGILVAGTADDCAAQLQQFVERGVDQVVLDFRLRPGDVDDQVARVAEDVLPRLRPSGA